MADTCFAQTGWMTTALLSVRTKVCVQVGCALRSAGTPSEVSRALRFVSTNPNPLSRPYGVLANPSLSYPKPYSSNNARAQHARVQPRQNSRDLARATPSWPTRSDVRLRNCIHRSHPRGSHDAHRQDSADVVAPTHRPQARALGRDDVRVRSRRVGLDPVRRPRFLPLIFFPRA